MEDSYEISKLKVVFFANPFASNIVEGRYGKGNFITQIFYVLDGVIIDVFKDKYFSGLYKDGVMPSFYYDSINGIFRNYFTKKELESGLVSGERLLEIYCIYNSFFLSYDLIKKNSDIDDDRIIDINKYSLKRKKGNLIFFNEE